MLYRVGIALLFLAMSPILDIAVDAEEHPVADAPEVEQPALVGKALLILEVDGPISIIGSEGWWASGLLHVQDVQGRRINLPFEYMPGYEWCRISSQFLQAEYPSDPAQAECAWLILLDDWMEREFSAMRIGELANFDGRGELTQKENGALSVLLLLNDPGSPNPKECLAQ
jgi:hypothetical protein